MEAPEEWEQTPTEHEMEAPEWEQKPNQHEFYIFNSQGNTNKEELARLATKVLKQTIPYERKSLHYDFFKPWYRDSDILCIHPAKNRVTGLIDHIFLFSSDYEEELDELEKINKRFPPVDSRDSSDLQNLQNTPKIQEDSFFPEINPWIIDQLFTGKNSLYFKEGLKKQNIIQHKKVVFELCNGEEYSSLLIEKAYLFTGLFLADEIIINISLEDCGYLGNNSRFDTIYKIFMAYTLALKDGLWYENREKKFFILIRAEQCSSEIANAVYQSYQTFLQEMLLEIKRLSQYSEDPNFLALFNGDEPPFSFNFLTYSRESILKTGEILFEHLMIPDQLSFWEENALEKLDAHPDYLKEFLTEEKSIKNGLCYTIPPYFISDLIDYFDRFAEENINFYKSLAFSEIEPIEIISEAACSKVVYVTLELVKCVMRPWHKLINSGWVQGLGKELDQLVKKIEEFYEREAGIFKHTKAYQRKLDQLTECFFMECRVTFQPQMNHLKENLKQYFKSACSNIGLTEGIERDLNRLIYLFDEEFVNQAKSSIPDCAKKKTWSYNYERENLKKIYDRTCR